jgi:hypothetical protein
MPAAVSGDVAEPFVASEGEGGPGGSGLSATQLLTRRIHRPGVGVGIFGGVGAPGIGDMLGIGDMDGIPGVGMFFIASFIDAQQPLSSFAWLAIAPAPIPSQQLLCEPGCAMRRYRPAAMTKMPTAMPVAARAG